MDASLWAYIDPMSGTLVLQVLIAACVGAAALFRKWIWKTVTWIASPFWKPGTSSTAEAASEQRKAA